MSPSEYLHGADGENKPLFKYALREEVPIMIMTVFQVEMCQHLPSKTPLPSLVLSTRTKSCKEIARDTLRSPTISSALHSTCNFIFSGVKEVMVPLHSCWTGTQLKELGYTEEACDKAMKLT